MKLIDKINTTIVLAIVIPMAIVVVMYSVHKMGFFFTAVILAGLYIIPKSLVSRREIKSYPAAHRQER